MDGLPSEIKISSDITQVLTEIGEWERLKGRLSTDFEGTFKRLEQIPEEVIRIIINGVDKEGMSVGMCIQYIQEIVETLLKKRCQDHHPRLEGLERNLHASLDKTLISLESLHLIEKYLQNFCHKYPPLRIPDWENPIDADYEHHGGDYDDCETWKHDMGGYEGDQQGDVGKNERMTLKRSICAIKCYITHIDTLVPPGRNLHPTLSKKYIAEESARIATLKRTINIIRNMLDWGNNHKPYHALCGHGEPLGHNFFDIDIIETIKTWEQVCKRLDLNKKQN